MPIRPKYPSNRALDEAIVKLYQSRPSFKQVSTFALGIKYPKWWVSRRAAALGVRKSRVYDPTWSDAEIAVLQRYYHRDVTQIQKRLRDAGFKRSLTAIGWMRRQRHGDKYAHEYLTIGKLAELCGVNDSTARLWTTIGGLRTCRKRESRAAVREGEHCYVEVSTFRAWAVRNVERVDLRKVDQVWFWRAVLLPLIARPVLKTTDDCCTWAEDTDSVWHTECGNAFVLNADGPRANAMDWCCYCGLTLRETPLIAKEAA